MANLFHERVPMTLPYHCGSHSLTLQVDEEILVADSESSTMRMFIRSNISKILKKQQRCLRWGDNIIEMVATCLDKKLFEEAKSFYSDFYLWHYTNLHTLEHRVNELMSTYEDVRDGRNAVSHVSSSSFVGMATGSTEMPHELEASSPAPSHDTSSLVSDCHMQTAVESLLPNGKIFSSLVPTNGLDSRHSKTIKVVSNISIHSGRTISLWPKDVPGVSNAQAKLMISKHHRKHTLSDDVTALSPEQYIRCRNSHVAHDNGNEGECSVPRMSSSSEMSNSIHNAGSAFTANTKLVHDRAAARVVLMDSHYNGVDHQLILENGRQTPLVSKRLAEYSVPEHLLQSRQSEKEFELPLPSSHQPHEQTDQHSHRQIGKLQQRLPLLVENNMLYQSQPDSILSASNGNVAPKQMPLEPWTRQNVRRKHQPSLNWPMKDPCSASDRDRKVCVPGNLSQEMEYNKRRKILFSGQEKECQYTRCMFAKRTLDHVSCCKDNPCRHDCSQDAKVFRHCRACKGEANSHLQMHLPDLKDSDKFMQRTHCASVSVSKATTPGTDTGEYWQSQKCLKTVHHSTSPMFYTESNQVPEQALDCIHPFPKRLVQICQQVNPSVNISTEIIEKQDNLHADSSQRNFTNFRGESGFEVDTTSEPGVKAIVLKEIDGHRVEDSLPVQIEPVHVELGINCSIKSPIAHVSRENLEKLKISGVSLVESFTPHQIKEHISSLRQCVSQSNEKEGIEEQTNGLEDKNSCDLCGVANLSFLPPPKFCTSCGRRIEHQAIYYSQRKSDTKTNGGVVLNCLCRKCYKLVSVELDVRINAEIAEQWVQCDKCECWQHQVCALFNQKKNELGQAEYTCPRCLLQEMERGEHMPITQNAFLAAKDLPTTKLSDHIEHRLLRRLMEERQERATSLGQKLDEVPTAKGLVVRVVSSVDKKLEVNRLIYELFQKENYPTEFPYKSKAILLFQNIEGADVCLFAIYAQEFGSDCAHPNQRHVCISYIDSVKYFRPEVKTITGEALRTFVYHEILVGYLDYCKKRGFTSTHIWVSPPLKHDDYILYCHPQLQKTPKSSQLYEWYLTVLRKATKENIVLGHTNLYDYYLKPSNEYKVKLTTAHLPYFEGDFWPGEAVKLLQKYNSAIDEQQEKKAPSGRAMRAGCQDVSTENSKDKLLLQQLGKCIQRMKKGFIVVHLQHSCNHCCRHIICGRRWVCKVCQKFQLCEECYDVEQNIDNVNRHPTDASAKHSFYAVDVDNVSADTDDKDKIIKSEFFDTRLDFLGLCQGNLYQFDTLRRAKHSTMMVLYHLHNMPSPSLTSPCSVCHGVLKMPQSWHCMTCPDYNACDSCYQREGGLCHHHKLVSKTFTVDSCELLNARTEQKQVFQEHNISDLILHASKCLFHGCIYPFCRRVKGLLSHGEKCQIRVGGGCEFCIKMWRLLHMHAKDCIDLECHVPQCQDLKDQMRKMQLQSSPQRDGMRRRMKEN